MNFLFRIFSRVGEAKSFWGAGSVGFKKRKTSIGFIKHKTFIGFIKRVFRSEKRLCVMKGMFIGNVFCEGLTVKFDISVLLYVLFIFAEYR